MNVACIKHLNKNGLKMNAGRMWLYCTLVVICKYGVLFNKMRRWRGKYTHIHKCIQKIFLFFFFLLLV